MTVSRLSVTDSHYVKQKKGRRVLRLFWGLNRYDLANALKHVLALFGVVAYFCLVVRQRDVKRLIDAVDVVDPHTFQLLRAQILFYVLPVFRRKNYIANTSAFCGKHLLLDSAYRQHIAAERDLTSHRC